MCEGKEVSIDKSLLLTVQDRKTEEIGAWMRKNRSVSICIVE